MAGFVVVALCPRQASTEPGIDRALDDHYVCVHPDRPLLDQLVVFLPGWCGRPEMRWRAGSGLSFVWAELVRADPF